MELGLGHRPCKGFNEDSRFKMPCAEIINDPSQAKDQSPFQECFQGAL